MTGTPLLNASSRVALAAFLHDLGEFREYTRFELWSRLAARFLLEHAV